MRLAASPPASVDRRHCRRSKHRHRRLRRGGGASAALCQVANRLVGILHGCLTSHPSPRPDRCCTTSVDTTAASTGRPAPHWILPVGPSLLWPSPRPARCPRNLSQSHLVMAMDTSPARAEHRPCVEFHAPKTRCFIGRLETKKSKELAAQSTTRFFLSLSQSAISTLRAPSSSTCGAGRSTKKIFRSAR